MICMKLSMQATTSFYCDTEVKCGTGPLPFLISKRHLKLKSFGPDLTFFYTFKKKQGYHHVLITEL